MTYKIAILGASGYTGAELIRLLATHPSFTIAALGAERKAGQSLAQVFPHLRHLDLPLLVKTDAIDFSQIDLCFCALPHKTSQNIIASLPADLKVVDLSADFRLRDPAQYEAWYGESHDAPALQQEAVYGLTEFYRDEIISARLVAGTGCNAATGQYMLRPLIASGLIDLDDIILDLKCAVSGAGRALKENLLHAELSEGYHAYALGGTHRHLGESPSTRHVRGSNFCHIGVTADRIPGRAIVIGALDNLTKGSSGQALQNANLMLGVPETAGLMLAPCFP